MSAHSRTSLCARARVCRTIIYAIFYNDITANTSKRNKLHFLKNPKANTAAEYPQRVT